MEIMNCIFGLFITIFMGWFAYASSLLVDAKMRYERKHGKYTWYKEHDK